MSEAKDEKIAALAAALAECPMFSCLANPDTDSECAVCGGAVR
jgi:hypothetical protein